MDIHYGTITAETDCDLLKQVRQGDERAITLLYDRHSTLVYSIALRILRDEVCAEDVLQEIFMEIWRCPDESSSVQGSFRPALIMASRNRSIVALRKRLPKNTDSTIPFSVGTWGDLTDDIVTNEAPHALLVELSAEQRALLDMLFFEGMTPSEIASISNCPLEAISRNIHLALSALRTLSSAERDVHPPRLTEDMTSVAREPQEQPF